MTMRCTGFCQPNSTIDEKVHRRHDQPDFREMNGQGERKKNNQIVSTWICVGCAKIYIYILLVLSVRDNQHARLVNCSQAFE